MSVTFFLPEGENSQRKVSEVLTEVVPRPGGKPQRVANAVSPTPRMPDVARTDATGAPFAVATSRAVPSSHAWHPAPPLRCGRRSFLSFASRVCTRCWFCVDYDEWVDWEAEEYSQEQTRRAREERVRTARDASAAALGRLGARAMRRREALEARVVDFDDDSDEDDQTRSLVGR